jgi:hypothetical protein
MAGPRSGRSSSSAASEANLGASQTHEVEASTFGWRGGAVPGGNRFDAQPRVRHSGSDRHLALESHRPTEGVVDRVSQRAGSRRDGFVCIQAVRTAD